MKSSVMNKSILAVALLMVACFAGFAVVGEDTDAAAIPYGVKLDVEVQPTWDSGATYSNEEFENNVAVEDGVITGSVTSSDAALAAAKKTWGDDTTYKYCLVFTITDLPVGYYVSYMSDGKVKSSPVGAQGDLVETEFTKIHFVDETNKNKSFVFAVTPAPQDDVESLAGLVTYEIPIDVKMDVKEMQIEYTINGLTIIQRADSGTAYSLVGLDALSQSIPSGQKFVGWNDGQNTYPVGTTLVLSNEGKYEYTAVFEDLPEIVITFIDGTSKVGECNVTEIATKTPDMAKVGYDFLGWYLNGVVVDPYTFNFTNSAVLVAGWEPIKCFVTFMVDGTIYQKQTVEYNDFATQPMYPAGYSGWDFDFATPITSDITVQAIAAPEPEPTGAEDPRTLTVYIIVALVIAVLIACVIYLIREGKIVVGLGKKKEIEAPAEEEPKQ